MIRFSICLETIFRSLPITERVEQAAACGAAGVEFWNWREKDLDELAHVKEAAGVDIAAFTASLANPPNNPAVIEESTAEMLEAVEAARGVGAAGLIVIADHAVPDVSHADQLDALTTVLRLAATVAGRAHVSLLVEPLNRETDHPEALLSGTSEALAVLDQIDEPNVKLLFDVYHQTITEGAVLDTIEKHIDRIGHFHIADVPGRGEPGTGMIDFSQLLQHIDSLDYQGFVGLEFYPSIDDAEAVRNTLALL